MAGTPGLKHYHAPGRVNLIGEHTDYNGGFVMPIAIRLGCDIHATPLAEPELRLESRQFAGELVFPLSVIPQMQKTGTWADYVLGVAKEVAALGHELRGMKLSIDATVPTGSGLSSSAALEVASALALLDGARTLQARTGQAVPAGGAQLRRHALRHHGPVRFGPRRRSQGHPARLPFDHAQAGADSRWRRHCRV